MNLKTTLKIVSFALAFCTECKAQDANKIELSILPALGFNLSFPVITPKSSRDKFSYTRGTAVPKDYFAGIGIQLSIWDEWQTTLKIARTAYGYGWRFKNPSTPSNKKSTSSSQSSTDINIFDFTTEKKNSINWHYEVVEPKL